MSLFTGEVILIPVLSDSKVTSSSLLLNSLKEGIVLVYGRIDSKIAWVSGSRTTASGLFCFIGNFSIILWAIDNKSLSRFKGWPGKNLIKLFIILKVF